MSYAPGAGPELPWEWSSILGGSCVLGELFYCLTSVVPFAGVFVLMLLLRLVLRRQWLASLALYLFIQQVASREVMEWILRDGPVTE